MFVFTIYLDMIYKIIAHEHLKFAVSGTQMWPQITRIEINASPLGPRLIE
jgi:hypothetical protein